MRTDPFQLFVQNHSADAFHSMANLAASGRTPVLLNHQEDRTEYENDKTIAEMRIRREREREKGKQSTASHQLFCECESWICEATV